MTQPKRDMEQERLIEVYRSESAENLATMEHSLLELERRGNADPELLRALFRAAHTIKGNSAMLGYEGVAGAAHELEDVLGAAQAGGVAVDVPLINRLLAGLDTLRAQMRTALGEQAPRGAHRDGGDDQGTLRVNMRRLDTLLDLTGEIATARGRLAQLVGTTAGADSALGATLWQLEQLHGALQGEVMQLRMVPLGPTFRPHHRTVRDVAAKRGKQTHLVIEGQDVEVDTRVAEQMRDPLTHMIRNAVDHGIETPAERRAAGKAPAGTVTLRATHTAGAVVIELSDDGRGLDRARIAAKAEALGVAADTSGWSDERVFGLIFESGFSTADEVTAVSGRGVGMDVVRRNIRSLRGTIDIASTPGRGTRFTIRLPLTVAIINGFLVGAGTETYVLPLETVEECVDFGTAHARGDSDGLLNLRDTAVPYARLDTLLGAPEPATRTDDRASVVVVRHGDRRVGLVVERLDGDCQAVIKPLAGALGQPRGIAGSTILGNGRVALIVDVAHLVESMTGRGLAHALAGTN